MDGWYYKSFEIEFGPVPLEKLVELVKDRSLSRDDKVRFGDKGNWRFVGSIGPLMAHLPFEAAEKVVLDSSAASQSPANLATATVRELPETQNFDIDFAESVSFAEPSTVTEAPASSHSAEHGNRWWYKTQDQELGPVDLLNLVELVKQRHLSRNDQVRFGENGNWRRVGSIGPLMAHLPFETAEKIVSNNGPQIQSKSSHSTTVNSRRSSDQSQYMETDFAKSASTSERHSTAETGSFAVIAGSADTVQFAKLPDIESRWWCKIQDKEYGPVELPKLIDWAATGRLRREDHVRLGVDPYVRADELPGLFPELPKSTTAETKSDSSTRSTIATTSASKPKSPDSANPAKPAVEPAAAATATVSKTSAPIEATPVISSSPTSSAPMSKSAPPTAKAPTPARPPFKPPLKKSSGGGKLGALLPIGLGVGASIIAVVLIYVGIQMIPPSTAEEVRRFKVLLEGYSSMQKIRDAGAKPSDEDLKTAKNKIIEATKNVNDELKKIEKKNPYQETLKSLATKMRSVANADFNEKQMSKIENDVSSLTTKLQQDLGLK